MVKSFHLPSPARADRVALVVLAAALASCGRAGTPALPQDSGAAGLIAHVRAGLDRIAGSADRDASAAALVRSWKLDADELTARVSPEYRALHRDYAVAYDRRAAQLAGVLARRAADREDISIAVRTHYADDPFATPAMVRLRWALPTSRPGWIVFTVPKRASSERIAGDVTRRRDLPEGAMVAARIDSVFVHTGNRWRILLGLQEAAAARVRELAGAECADKLDPECRVGRCIHETYQVFRAALSGDDRRVRRACEQLSKR